MMRISKAIPHIVCTFLLILTSLVFVDRMSAQDAWQLYREAPMGVVPVQLEQGNDGTLYAMSNRGVLYYRENGDSVWTKVQNIQPWWNVSSFAVDPESNRLFLNTAQQGIRFSDNFGENWSFQHFFTTDAGLHASIFDILPFDDSNTLLLASGFNFELGFFAIYRSMNNGGTWQTLQAPSTMLSLFRTAGGRIIGVSDGLGVFVSDDNGTNWTSVGMEGIQFGDFAETNDGIIYATTAQAVQSQWEGVWASADDGQTWSQQNEGLSEPGANALSYLSATDQLLLATNHGLYERVNGVWIEVPNSLTDAPTNDVLITPTQIYTGMPVFGVQFSSATSGDWTALNEGFPSGMDAYAFNSQNMVLAAYSNGLGVYSAEASGTPWNVQMLPENSFTPLSVLKIERAANGRIYIMDFDELFVSEDEGMTFQNITPDLPLAPGSFSVQLKEMSIAGNGDMMIVQALDNRVHHSVDGGASFEILLEGSDIDEPFFVDHIRRSDAGHYYLVVQTAMNKRLYHSADGNQWGLVDLTAVADESTAVGFNLDRAANGEIIISLNHKPYIIQDADQSLTPIAVPWVFENPNAVFDFEMDAQGNSYILTYPTFGSLSYEGIWRSGDGGETWLNIGFPANGTGTPMESIRLGFNQDDVPFVISGEAFTDFPIGLYYYGVEDLLSSVEGKVRNEQTFKLYPNPVRSNGQITVESESMRAGDRVLITNLQQQSMFEMNVSDAIPVSVAVSNLKPGIYLVYWLQDNEVKAIRRLVVI